MFLKKINLKNDYYKRNNLEKKLFLSFCVLYFYYV